MKKVLIIDDDRELARELAETLSDEGYYTASEVDGQRGLERICAEPWHAVVFDFKMPGLNGIDLLARCRELQAPPAMILISGSLDIQARLEQAGLENDVVWVFTKPFDIEKLLRVIENIAGG
jgi:DNA-binding response OmpR family regulator